MDQTPSSAPETSSSSGPRHKRRARYPGKYPRRFEEKYKEHEPQRYRDAVQKVLDAGKTPAGMHRPIMVPEVLAALRPQPGETAVDCTLGYGGHTRALLARVLPAGRVLAIDQDPIELAKTEARLRTAGFGAEALSCYRTNFAGLSKVIASAGLATVDIILADLGVSSMQLDDPARGFSWKYDGPLDMRMNPRRGQSASDLLVTITADRLTRLLADNADEPFAQLIGESLAGRRFGTARDLTARIEQVLSHVGREEQDKTVRRTFQALRIAVNDEFSALRELLRQAPACLKSGGRIAVMTFHSGEDRLVKAAFAEAVRSGVYSEVSRDVARPSAAERIANPRSTAAKLRWAIRG